MSAHSSSMFPCPVATPHLPSSTIDPLLKVVRRPWTCRVPALRMSFVEYLGWIGTTLLVKST